MDIEIKCTYFSKISVDDVDRHMLTYTHLLTNFFASSIKLEKKIMISKNL